MDEDTSEDGYVGNPVGECSYCGQLQSITWSTDLDRWETAMTGAGHTYESLCPSCFVMWHEQATGMRTTWMLVPDPKATFRPVRRR